MAVVVVVLADFLLQFLLLFKFYVLHQVDLRVLLGDIDVLHVAVNLKIGDSATGLAERADAVFVIVIVIIVYTIIVIIATAGVIVVIVIDYTIVVVIVETSAFTQLISHRRERR